MKFSKSFCSSGKNHKYPSLTRYRKKHYIRSAYSPNPVQLDSTRYCFCFETTLYLYTDRHCDRTSKFSPLRGEKRKRLRGGWIGVQCDRTCNGRGSATQSVWPHIPLPFSRASSRDLRRRASGLRTVSSEGDGGGLGALARFYL